MNREFYSALLLAQLRHQELLREAEAERQARALRWQQEARRDDRRKPSFLRRLLRQARHRPVL